MKIQIKHRFNESVLYECEAENIKEAILRACKDNANLYNANLSNANLSNANLFNANLYNANLSNANLSNANLFNANLSNANLSNVDLRNVDLRNANLYNANLSNVDLSNVDLYNANLYNANLFNVKNYADNHDIALEIIKREKIETFKKSEWELIGKISLHRFCWDTILKQPLKPVLRIFKILKDKGFPEYYDKAKEVLKGKINER